MVICFLKEETDDEEPIPQGMVEGAQVGSHQKHRFIFTVLVFVFVFEGVSNHHSGLNFFGKEFVMLSSLSGKY